MNTMEMLIKNEYRMTYANKDLQSATKSIYKLGDEIKDNLYRVAYIIAHVNTTQAYKEEGYKNVHEWTKEAFGMASTHSYNLLRIGNDYTEEITNGKTKTYRSNLTVESSLDDFSTTQVEAMLPVTRDKALELIENAEITTDMTIRDIKKKIKEVKEAEKGGAEGDGTGEGLDIPEPEEVCYILIDPSTGVKYRIPVDYANDHVYTETFDEMLNEDNEEE